MKNEVFITETASFFPNNPIDNNSIENYLGLISGQHSRVKNLVLTSNPQLSSSASFLRLNVLSSLN